MKNNFLGVSEETIAKYKPILAKPVETTKEDIKQLVKNYYDAVIKEDKDSINSIAEEINSYIDLDVPEFNNYLTYCFLTSINEILVRLYGTDLDFYVPEDPDLKFIDYHERIALASIKEHGLTAEEVDLIIQYNKESLEIYALTFLGYDRNDFKPKTVLSANLKNEAVLLNSNYTGINEIETSAKLFYAMGKGRSFIND